MLHVTLTRDPLCNEKSLRNADVQLLYKKQISSIVVEVPQVRSTHCAVEVLHEIFRNVMLVGLLICCYVLCGPIIDEQNSLQPMSALRRGT